MLVPLSWLADYVTLPENLAELLERLTLAGLEATGVQFYGLPKPPNLRVKSESDGLVWDRDRVVVARVLEITKHPNADKLKLVRLDYGAGEKTVVTGAPNIAVGQSGMKVVLGNAGTTYYMQGKDGSRTTATLVAKELRGILNDAMVMSDYELGISEDHEGIILLDDTDGEPGTPVQDVLGEIVVELDILPSMARCLALLGIAREVAALTGNQVREPSIEVRPLAEPVTPLVTVSIADPKLCPRYAAAVIRNVTIGPAPRQMRSRLRYAGMRPINSVVDITNFVMLEYGQPLHAFDYDVLVRRAGGKPPAITVRPAREGERLVTLDGIERQLTPETLIIADTAGPIALAGVMGGRDTEVTATTRTILLEAANFDFVSIRKTARQFHLFSEASTRFSRGIHPEVVRPAALRALHLLQHYAGGEVYSGLVDQYPEPLPERPIQLNRTEISRLLGVDFPDVEVERILTALQFRWEATLWGWQVTPPPTRLDLQAGAADLVEELARISGYDRLPTTRLAVELPEYRGDPTLVQEDRVRDLLADSGLQEVITYSLIGADAESRLAFQPGNFTQETEQEPEPVKIINAVSPERSQMRRTLLPGLLDVAAENLKNAASIALFEIGPVYLPKPGQTLPAEPRRLGIILSGPRHPGHWQDPLDVKPGNFDFFDLKGIIDGLIHDLHLPQGDFEPLRDRPYLHPARSARWTIGTTVLGVFGELHPRVAPAFRLAERTVLIAEIDLESLLRQIPDRFVYRPISPYPPVLRDIAVVVAESLPVQRVYSEILAAGGELLEAATLFDLYRGESIPTGTKSLAFALTYRVADRQLSDKEVDKTHQKIESRLKQMLQAQIRGKSG